jgi:C1A family cysteine protease
MKSVLAAQYLIEFGFQVYDYFMSADMAAKGLLPVPASSEQLQGGHAVALVGYDDSKVITAADGAASKGAFLVRNSWGANWGLSGYFWMAYDYVANTTLCSDFWVIQSAPI